MAKREASDTALQSYLEEIARFPLLGREEEREVALRARQGDQEARARMITSNLRLVVDIARHYRGAGLPLMDLIAEGNLGLLKAVERFDPQKGFRFSTYATWWIRRTIRRAIKTSAGTIRIPTYMVETVARAKQVYLELEARYGRKPTLEEVGEEMRLRPHNIALLKQAMRLKPIRSLQQNVNWSGTGTDVALEALLESRARPRQAAFSDEERRRLLNMLDSIDERQATILTLRFGLAREKPMTLEAVGNRIGLSRERVRQLEKEALERLKKAMQEV